MATRQELINLYNKIHVFLESPNWRPWFHPVKGNDNFDYSNIINNQRIQELKKYLQNMTLDRIVNYSIESYNDFKESGFELNLHSKTILCLLSLLFEIDKILKNNKNHKSSDFDIIYEHFIPLKSLIRNLPTDQKLQAIITTFSKMLDGTNKEKPYQAYNYKSAKMEQIRQESNSIPIVSLGGYKLTC